MFAPLTQLDNRWKASIVLVVASAAVAMLISALPERGVDAGKAAATIAAGRPSPFSELQRLHQLPSSPPVPEIASPRPATADEVRVYGALGRARGLIKESKPNEAIAVLNADQPVLANDPQAFLLLGQALEMRGDPMTARDFYLAAIDRNPTLYDAYWGVATASESLGELPAAIGAMRNYLHTEPDRAPDRLRVNQARSAIWEWESLLGRGPWGPTKGVPPDFRPEEIRRDGRGVGVKMQRPETLRSDGTWLYEIKSADKVQIYPRP